MEILRPPLRRLILLTAAIPAAVHAQSPSHDVPYDSAALARLLAAAPDGFAEYRLRPEAGLDARERGWTARPALPGRTESRVRERVDGSRSEYTTVVAAGGSLMSRQDLFGAWAGSLRRGVLRDWQAAAVEHGLRWTECSGGVRGRSVLLRTPPDRTVVLVVARSGQPCEASESTAAGSEAALEQVNRLLTTSESHWIRV